MKARIKNYPNKRTLSYAQLWSDEPFVVPINQLWWPSAYPLASELKGDEWGIGTKYKYKMDIPGPCWVVWIGTGRVGYRTLQTQQAASVEVLDNPPGPGFLDVQPGVNVIAFEEDEPEPGPEEPEEPGEDPPEENPPEDPEPEQPGESPLPPGWKPQSIHIYMGGTPEGTPVVSYYVNAMFASLGIQRHHYLSMWDKLEQLLVGAVSEFH